MRERTLSWLRGIADWLSETIEPTRMTHEQMERVKETIDRDRIEAGRDEMPIPMPLAFVGERVNFELEDTSFVNEGEEVDMIRLMGQNVALGLVREVGFIDDGMFGWHWEYEVRVKHNGKFYTGIVFDDDLIV